MQAEISSQGIHIPSLKIDRHRSIVGLELPRLAQVNLFAGRDGLLMSSFLGAVAEMGVDNSKVLKPDWWDHVALENEDELLIASSERSGSLLMDAGETFGGGGIEIRRFGRYLTLPMERRGKDWFFFISKPSEAFEAGGLIDQRLLDPEINNNRVEAHLHSADVQSVSGFVIRVRAGVFELGWLFGSSVESRLEFRDMFEVGWDAAKAMVLMSAISEVPKSDGFGTHKTVFLIDNIGLSALRSAHAAFWGLIVDALDARDAQLLATTNSYDCIAGFADAGVSNPDASLRFFRLEQAEHQTHYVDYDPLTLQLSFDTGIDPR